MEQTKLNQSGFHGLGITQVLLEVLNRLKFICPTPIQNKCIPIGLQGKDIIGIAQTGTGKTLAFGIPLIQSLVIQPTKNQGLILLPTRELALQVNEVLEKIGRSFGLRTAVLIGGASASKQIAALRRNPHIIVSTPGRLIDHLQQKRLSFERIQTVVLDEADRMFDIGFLPQIKQILSFVPKIHQTFLFSATMPKAIHDLSLQFMENPQRIEVAPEGTPASEIEQEIFVIHKEGRTKLLDKLLVDHLGTVLIFSRTKHGAKKLAKSVRDMGHSATEIHSNRSLFQRQAALSGFKTGKYRVLVATDIAARGIDVERISLVINYDLPDNPHDYIHRIGRTGRAGNSGKAVSFAGPQERGAVRQIERLIKKNIPVATLPPLLEFQITEREVKSGFNTRSRRNVPFHGRRQNRNIF